MPKSIQNNVVQIIDYKVNGLCNHKPKNVQNGLHVTQIMQSKKLLSNKRITRVEIVVIKWNGILI